MLSYTKGRLAKTKTAAKEKPGIGDFDVDIASRLIEAIFATGNDSGGIASD
jgi:hypothetical protein